MRLLKAIAIIIAMLSAAGVWAQSAHIFAPESVLGKGRWVKIAISGREDGVYEITYQQLAKMGFGTPENVGVYGFGGHMLEEDFSVAHIDDLPENAVMHDKAGRRILFYAQGLVAWKYDKKTQAFKHIQNPYAVRACYFLHEKNTAAKEMEVMENGEESAEQIAVTTFDAHLLHEKELTNIGKTGRELYGESFVYSQSQNFSFAETLQPGAVHITANFAALSPTAASFSIKHGDKIVTTATIPPSNNAYVYATEATAEEEIELLQAEQPSFRINLNAASSIKVAHLNYICVEGKQNIAIEGDESYTLFRNTASDNKKLKYIVGNSTAKVWDVTDPQNVRLQTQDPDGSFVAKEVGLKEYALVDIDGKRFPGVNIIGEINNQNLHGTGDIDMVIVSAPGLKSYAQQLADFRTSHDNMRVKVVTAEEVYNEYSSGTADATAIRLYMKQLFGNKQRDGYLLLFGDGHYNNRKTDGAQNYLITYETTNSLVETSSTVCDDYFGFLDDSEGRRMTSNGHYDISADVADIGIGRITVHSTSDAAAVVKKIIAYSDNKYYGNWKNRLCFVSDDDKISDSATDTPNAHMRHNDQVINVLQNEQEHKEFHYQKIYLPAYTQTTTASGTDYPDARKEFLETLQQGALIVNYAGHGANNSITNEMLMTTSRASQLNMKNLPLWVTASCDISRWDDDDDSLGEALFTNHNGGAIALISTTRVVYSSQNLLLNLAIAKALFKRKSDGSRYRLGDILMEAKQSLGGDYNKLNFCLLGDPSMILSYPEYEMEITGIDYGERTIVSGRVIDPGTHQTATDFNGLVYPTIYDAPDSIFADKGLHQEPIYKFAAYNKKIFSGRDIIRNGVFEFSFITPKDVSEFSTEGIINLYACNESNDEGNGYYDGLIIRKPTATGNDTDGPEIRNIFVNSSSFCNGDVVGNTPYFFAEVHDASGFNATGNRVGHDVSLTIHSTSNLLLADQHYVLNNYLTTYTGDPTSGNVRFSIPELAEGEYDLTFRIWDSMNNSSRAQIHISVSNSHPHQPVLVQAFPSPVSQGEEVSFRILHNLPESPTTMRLQIYSQTGAKVYETTTTTSSAEVVFLKNGATEKTEINTALNADETSEFFGSTTIGWRANVAPGIYIYKVYISSAGSETTSESKLFMVKP